MNAQAHANEHGRLEDGHGDEGHAHSTLRGYMIGFVLSVILTAVPFWLVMSDALTDNQLTAFAIMGFAVAQIIVHMIYFLHMSPKMENGWSMLALIFTLLIVVITLAGSLWVMYHLNVNMMPSHEMGQTP